MSSPTPARLQPSAPTSASYPSSSHLFSEFHSHPPIPSPNYHTLRKQIHSLKSRTLAKLKSKFAYQLIPHSNVRSVLTILFPIFASYKALRTPDPAQLTPWLMYWVVLSCFSLVESWSWFILSWWGALVSPPPIPILIPESLKRSSENVLFCRGFIQDQQLIH